MAKDPAFLFYPGDYLRDTQCLSEKTQVAYDRIMCEHMRNICISQKQLDFFTKRLSPDEVGELMFTLSKIKGGFCIDWIAESITKRRSYSESRRKNRSGKVKEDMNNICLHMENENEIENVIKDKDKVNVTNSDLPIQNPTLIDTSIPMGVKNTNTDLEHSLALNCEKLESNTPHEHYGPNWKFLGGLINAGLPVAVVTKAVINWIDGQKATERQYRPALKKAHGTSHDIQRLAERPTDAPTKVWKNDHIPRTDLISPEEKAAKIAALKAESEERAKAWK